MTKKKVVLLILVTMVLIGFTVYSILHEDLSTVQAIFGQSTATESKEFTNNDENKANENLADNTMVGGVLNLEGNDADSTQDTEENTTDNTTNSSIDEVASKLSVNNTTNSATISSDSNTSTTETANNTTSNSTKENGSVGLDKTNGSSVSAANPLSNSQTTATVKDSLKVGSNADDTSTNNTAKSTSNVTNKVNAISNSIVNKSKLPAAGNKTILIWIVIGVLAISTIAIISNIRYRDIPLK